MLCLLKIRNIALIEDAEVEFSRGLNVVTGETGSGKTILLESLGLLLGERASGSLVRKGAKRGSVEAIVDLAASADVRAWLAEAALASDDPGELVVRREIPAEGRSRAWINGRLVTIGQLAELGERLASVQSQHDAQRLVSPAWQRSLFDAYGRHEQALAKVAAAWEETKAARARLAALESDDKHWRQRLEFLRFQIAELEAANLEAGEEEHLRAERTRLSNSESLGESAARLVAALSEGDVETPSALDRLGVARQEIARMMRHDPELGELSAQLEEAMSRLGDVARDAVSYADRLESDPQRLEAVETRLDLLEKLRRKYGAESERLLGLLSEMEEEADALENRDTTIDAARAETERAAKSLADAAAELTALRRRTAKRFRNEVQSLLRELGMPGARFDAELASLDEPANHGAESIRLLLSANSGEPSRPIADVASGGELSRVMLALHTLAASDAAGRLHVFDEIDAGLSGKATVRMASALQTLASGGQVVCVTHQATVASQAERHLMVEKGSRSGRTTTTNRALSGTEREAVLARLLDGTAGTKSRALAAEMLLGRE